MNPNLSFSACFCISISVLLFSGELLYLSKEWLITLSAIISFAFYNASFQDVEKSNEEVTTSDDSSSTEKATATTAVQENEKDSSQSQQQQQGLSDVTNLLVSPTILEKRNKKRELEALRLSIQKPMLSSSSASSTTSLSKQQQQQQQQHQEEVVEEESSFPFGPGTVVTPIG